MALTVRARVEARQHAHFGLVPCRVGGHAVERVECSCGAAPRLMHPPFVRTHDRVQRPIAHQLLEGARVCRGGAFV